MGRRKSRGYDGGRGGCSREVWTDLSEPVHIGKAAFEVVHAVGNFVRLKVETRFGKLNARRINSNTS